MARDVLEFVVFEKHVANTYGAWRIHDKIFPYWMQPQDPIRKTYRMEREVKETSTPADETSEAAVAPQQETLSAVPAGA